MVSKPLRIVGAAVLVACAAACSEPADPRVLAVGMTAGEGSGNGRLFVSVLPDDLMLATYWADHHEGRDAEDFRIRAGAAWLVREIWDEEWEKDWDYVTVAEGGTIGYPIPAGRYTFELVDGGGEVAVRTAPVTIAEGVDVVLVVHGSPGSFSHRLLVDDYAGIPAHMTRLRVVNTFDTREALDVVACPDDDGDYADCEVLHADLAYGELFEQLLPVSGDGAVRLAGILRDRPPGFEGAHDVIAMSITPAEAGWVSSIFPWHQYAAENEPCPFCAALVIIDSTVLAVP